MQHRRPRPVGPLLPPPPQGPHDPRRRRRGRGVQVTVSNVVRGAEGVSEATRARVQEEIARLNYKPNAIARQFVNQRTTRASACSSATCQTPTTPRWPRWSSERRSAVATRRCAHGAVRLKRHRSDRADRGLREPRAQSRDLSVVGFDDIALAGLHRISLTTVAQSLEPRPSAPSGCCSSASRTRGSPIATRARTWSCGCAGPWPRRGRRAGDSAPRHGYASAVMSEDTQGGSGSAPAARPPCTWSGRGPSHGTAVAGAHPRRRG